MNFPVYPESAAREAVRTLPRLTSDEYLAFVTDLLSRTDPVKVARQKALEERITVPFRLVPEREEGEVRNSVQRSRSH